MTPNIVEVASLIGDESRAAMLMCLLSGKALTASELARAAGVTPQTASSHLLKMLEGGLLLHESYGRHRYFRLATPEVGHALEALSTIARPKPIRSLRESDQSKALHFARTCYDHIAGEVGVTLTDRTLELGLILKKERDFVITADGARWFLDFGINLDEIRRRRRHFARRCLDWSERRYHLAGALGAAFMNRLFELGWIERASEVRALRITPVGYMEFEDKLGVSFARHPPNRTKI